MRVQINRVDSDGHGCRVLASSAYGDFAADWHGSIPETGREYDVELDTNERLRWGSVELDVVRDNWVGIRQKDGVSFIQGYLELAQPDGYTVLRLGQMQQGPILNIETEGQPPARGKLVCARVSDLSIWDEHL